MIGAGLAAIAARVAGLALLLAPPARGTERMPVLPEELAVTRSIDVQDEDEFQTSLSARQSPNVSAPTSRLVQAGEPCRDTP